VIDEYGMLGFLWLVQGGSHSLLRPRAQQASVTLLRAILDRAQPGRRKAADYDKILASVHQALGR
jgi:hypothetical protein